MLATRRPLPHTDAMAIIPLSNRSKPFDTPNGPRRWKRTFGGSSTIKDGSFQRLIDAENTLRFRVGLMNRDGEDARRR